MELLGPDMGGLPEAIRLVSAAMQTARDVIAEALAESRLNSVEDAEERADAVLAAREPVLAAHERQVRAEALREFAAFIDSGPAVPLKPSIYSSLAQERADEIAGEAG